MVARKIPAHQAYGGVHPQGLSKAQRPKRNQLAVGTRQQESKYKRADGSNSDYGLKDSKQ